MSSSNRVEIASVREITPGTTPASPRLRTVRLTGESLSFTPEFVESEELRADRNMGDPIRIIQGSSGGINFELSYPDTLSPMAEFFRSAFFNPWEETPVLNNDGIADSIISDVAVAGGGIWTVTSTTGFKVGHLINASGFTNANNNGLFRLSALTATTLTTNIGSFSAEAAPPGTARLKVVGWQPTVHDHVQSATVVSGGTGGTAGPVTITGTTGTGTKFQATGTITGGILQPGLIVTIPGNYTVNPTNPNVEPVTGGALVGATVNLNIGGSITALSSSIEVYDANVDFLTMLQPGQWIKIGGSAATAHYDTLADNDWVRVVSVDPINATKGTQRINLDNLPAGWVQDLGLGKAIRLSWGDQIRNGVTPNAMTIQKGFLDQATPTYIVNRGMQVNTMNFTVINREKIRGVVDMMGMTGQQSTTSIDPSGPDPATTGAIMAAHANVGRLSEAGTKLTDPNWASEISFQINNNLRRMEAVDEQSPVGINAGECTVTGRIVTYFGSNAILQKLYNGTATSLNARITKNNQAVIFQFPRVTLRNGVPAAAGKNQDISLASDWSAGYDPTLGCAIICDRIEYFENV